MAIRNRESDLVRACLDWLALRGIKAWRTNNTGIYDPVRKVYRGFQGLHGVSDILGILPQTVDLNGKSITFGNFLAIEVKRPGKSLRTEQESFLLDVRQRGGIGICVRSVVDLERELALFPVG
jgi:hypothetical protein